MSFCGKPLSSEHRYEDVNVFAPWPCSKACIYRIPQFLHRTVSVIPWCHPLLPLFFLATCSILCWCLCTFWITTCTEFSFLGGVEWELPPQGRASNPARQEFLAKNGFRICLPYYPIRWEMFLMLMSIYDKGDYRNVGVRTIKWSQLEPTWEAKSWDCVWENLNRKQGEGRGPWDWLEGLNMSPAMKAPNSGSCRIGINRWIMPQQ